MNQGFPIRMLNGVGVVASKKRNIDLSNRYDAYFPLPEYSDPLLVANGSNEMTIEQFVPRIVRDYSYQTAKIAELLKKDTLEATCRAIFDFIYKNIQYTPDSPFEEQIRQPARTWADRVKGVDCDCYTTFVSSVLTNLRIPHYLRMSAYNANRGFQHIYVIVPKNANNLKGDYWTIDPVLDFFNQEKKPIHKKHDRLMQPVSALNVGVNGFPIRMLNGGALLKSPLVYDDVYYSPLLGTWALKGLDGGYYIEGDYNKRFVEPLEGVGLGWFGTAFKVGKGLVKGFKKVRKVVKTARANRKAAKAEKSDGAAGEQQGQSVTPVNASNLTPVQLPDYSGGFDAIQGKLTATNNSIIQSLAQSKKGNDDKISALNKSTVMSLMSLDKGTKDKLTEISKAFGSQVERMLADGASVKDIIKNSKEISQAALMNTATLNKKEEERTKEIITTVENTAREQQGAIAKTNNNQKYLLIAVAVLAVITMLNTIKGSKQQTSIS